MKQTPFSAPAGATAAPVVAWAEVEPLSAGTYKAACLSATTSLTQAGAPAIVWTFLCEGRQLRRTTPRKGPGAVFAFEVAEALGLGKVFKLSDAVGRLCTVILKQSGQFLNVDSVLPRSGDCPGCGHRVTHDGECLGGPAVDAWDAAQSDGPVRP